ncbi:MAG: Dabb family protein [Prolixibacteraceae bacterium]|nr:Dabb family protein [Prolixibacteraceae bacterium]
MINHVVLFKLNEYPEEEKKKVISEMKSELEGLKDKIKELKFIEVGVNYQLNSKSFDIVLLSHFNNLEDLDVYRDHPEHLKVVDKIAGWASARAAVDYEF